MATVSDIDFITTAGDVVNRQVIDDLVMNCGVDLYPGDERRIFGDALSYVIFSVYNAVNDAARQKMLRYARGPQLDALGARLQVVRSQGTHASVALDLTVNGPACTVVIPAGSLFTSDGVNVFATEIARAHV